MVTGKAARRADADAAAQRELGLALRKRRRPHEIAIQGLLFLCGAISILTTVGIAFGLVEESVHFFTRDGVSLVEFFTGTRWNPQIGQFGIWPLVVATLRTSTIAVLVAMPLGLSVAIYLAEYASPRARAILKPVLEVLSGIPTVVYGYFALTFMTQLLRRLLGADTVQIYNTASAGIVTGILILPLVSSMSEDALSAVPRSLREGAYALGATRWETAVKVVVPAAMSGVAAAFIVSVSRAIGETMIVAIAAG
ncbi:MAG TPA: phosphate ABC transporter permease subunit PstC, partial [Anaerolineae bacterium]|nr:phosphate ABC transporter permease subunit PstC [Anaerolineae bacterium]